MADFRSVMFNSNAFGSYVRSKCKYPIRNYMASRKVRVKVHHIINYLN